MKFRIPEETPRNYAIAMGISLVIGAVLALMGWA